MTFALLRFPLYDYTLCSRWLDVEHLWLRAIADDNIETRLMTVGNIFDIIQILNEWFRSVALTSTRIRQTSHWLKFLIYLAF